MFKGHGLQICPPQTEDFHELLWACLVLLAQQQEDYEDQAGLNQAEGRQAGLKKPPLAQPSNRKTPKTRAGLGRGSPLSAQQQEDAEDQADREAAGHR
uniref:Uncharacterized protein n=1 Tax=Sphaerodactylus townsendi TaxID=933632 RepID=A0ACB8FHI9_9SAUR